MFRKKNKYNIDSKTANEALQNVFAACDKEPNKTPLEVIKVRNLADTAIVSAGFWVGVILLVAVILMPLAFRVSPGAGKTKSDVRIVNHYIDKDVNCFVIEFDGEGVIYEHIYARRDNGTTVYPSDIDADNKTVKIPFKGGNLNIFIPKEDGTTMQAVLSK